MKDLLICLFCAITLPAVSQDTLILQPGPEGKDDQINSVNDNTNFLNTQMFKSMSWTYWGVPGDHRTLIEFDLSAISPESTVLHAGLDLFYRMNETNEITHTGANASYLMRITEPWQENEVTRNNQPEDTLEGAVILPRSTEPEQDYPDIIITGLVQAMVFDPEYIYGLMLRLIVKDYYRSLLFSSGDCLDTEKRPRLEIIYDT